MKTIDRLFVPGFGEIRAGAEFSPVDYAQILSARAELHFEESECGATAKHGIVKKITASNDSIKFNFYVRFMPSDTLKVGNAVGLMTFQDHLKDLPQEEFGNLFSAVSLEFHRRFNSPCQQSRLKHESYVADILHGAKERN